MNVTAATRIASVLVLSLPLRPPLAAQDSALASFLESEQATGDWGGQRSHLAEHGIEFDLFAREYLGSVIAGGRRQRSSEFSFLDAAATFDLERLHGLTGQQVYLRLALRRGGDGLTDDVGALQRLNRLEGDSGFFVGELWYGYTSPDELVRVWAGKVDAQRALARMDSLRLNDAPRGFQHGAVGLDNVLLPFWPNSAVGAMVEHRLPGGWGVSAALFDAARGGLTDPQRGLSADFEEHLAAVEVSYDWTGLGDAEYGRAGLGLWHHSGEFADRDGSTQEGEEGGYLFGEQELWRGAGARGEAPSMSVFGQLGWNHQNTFAVSHHLGVGARLVRYLPSRPRDETGVFFSFAYVRDRPELERELSMEAFHRLQVLPSLAVTPVVQWVIEPAGVGTDALVLGLGLELAL